MPALPQDELDDLLQVLGDNDPAMRAAALQTLIADPAADPRLIGPVERLITDRTAVVVSVPPPRVGEIRWLAAHALAAVRRMLDIAEPVILRGVPAPLDGAGVAAAAEAAGGRTRGGIDGVIATYAALAERGMLPAVDLIVGGHPPAKGGN